MAIGSGAGRGTTMSGFVTDSTGPLAAAGLSYTHGAELAVAEIAATNAIATGAQALVGREGGGRRRGADDPGHASVRGRPARPGDELLHPVPHRELGEAGGDRASSPLVVYGATAPGLPSPPWVYNVTALPGPKDVETASRPSPRR